MINAIARWHLNARPAGGDLEQAYADKLMVEIQELNVQITQVRISLEGDSLPATLYLNPLYCSDSSLHLEMSL